MHVSSQLWERTLVIITISMSVCDTHGKFIPNHDQVSTRPHYVQHQISTTPPHRSVRSLPPANRPASFRPRHLSWHLLLNAACSARHYVASCAIIIAHRLVRLFARWNSFQSPRVTDPFLRPLHRLIIHSSVRRSRATL